MTYANFSSAENPATPEAIGALRAHPRFGDAIRASASGIVAKYEGTRLLNWLMDDRARLVFGYVALSLHFSRDAADAPSKLTPTRMKSLCAAYGICSPGRAVAMLSLMRLGGYLKSDPHVSDRRQRGLIATDKLIGLVRERWRIQYTAMAPLFPDGDTMVQALDDDSYVGALARAMHARYDAGFRFMAHTPQIGLFAERSGGVFILLSLLAAGGPDDTMPPLRPVRLSISLLARLAGVSRPHVIKLIRDAVDAGLIERAGQDGVALRPRFADAGQEFFAITYLFFADSAREALAAGRATQAA